MIRRSLLMICVLAGCDAPQSGAALSGSALEARLSNSQLSLNVVEGSARVPVVLRLRADKSMTVTLNGRSPKPYAWQVKGNQLCTTTVVGGQAIRSSRECGTVAIAGDKITLRQTTSSSGSGDVLTGRIAPL